MSEPGCKLQAEPLFIEGHDLTIPDIAIYRDRPAKTKNIEMVTIRADRVTLVRPRIYGSKPYLQGFSNKFEGEHGIGIHGCQDVRIIEPLIHNVRGDFVYIGQRGRILNADILIEQPDFVNCGRQGISALSVRRLTVTGPGRVWGFRNSGVDTERQFGKRSVHEDIHIDRSTVEIASWRKLRRAGKM